MKKDRSEKNVFNRRNIKAYANDLLAGIVREIPEGLLRELDNEVKFRLFMSENFIYKETQFQFMIKYMKHKEMIEWGESGIGS